MPVDHQTIPQNEIEKTEFVTMATTEGVTIESLNGEENETAPLPTPGGQSERKQLATERNKTQSAVILLNCRLTLQGLLQGCRGVPGVYMLPPSIIFLGSILP